MLGLWQIRGEYRELVWMIVKYVYFASRLSHV